ncbi:MAG: S1 RNA-binding domain-containing protein, partial [Desulfobacteraceae bacterium]
MENIVENDSTQSEDQDKKVDNIREEAFQENVDAELEASDLENSDFDDDELDGEDSMEDLMDMYEESFKRFAEGEVVTGRIISIDKEHVLVDIGYKSEGQIRIDEFRDENGDIQATVDDNVEVMVEWWDDENEV